MGYPVAHSWSPFIHGMFAKNTGQDISYARLEVQPEEFQQAVELFFEDDGKGLNITVPHKQAALLVSRYRTPRAEIAGAVNTLALQDGSLLGDNTDGAGLVTDLTNNLGFTLAEARILLLGAGGATRGVLAPLLAAAPAHLLIANRTIERASALAKEFGMLGEVRACGFEDIEAGAAFDLVVNATSASLQDAVPPIRADLIGPTTLCYDMAYGKGDTAFTRWAKAAGAARAETGWGMLVEQAAESFQLWRGLKPDTRPVLEAVKSL